MGTDRQTTNASPSILLAEDNPEDAEWFRRALAREGFSVAVVTDGNAALEYLREHPYPETRLAILDVVLPGKDGYQLALDLHIYVELRPLPVILVSGLTDGSSMASAAGAEYFQKPVDPEALLECVDRLLELTPGPSLE